MEAVSIPPRISENTKIRGHDKGKDYAQFNSVELWRRKIEPYELGPGTMHAVRCLTFEKVLGINSVRGGLF